MNFDHDPRSQHATTARNIAASFGTPQKEQDASDLFKGGEGSRGGKIIGHTKSGKPIYASAHHEEHKHFDAHDHLDAYFTNGKKAKSGQDMLAKVRADNHAELAKNLRIHPQQLPAKEFSHVAYMPDEASDRALGDDKSSEAFWNKEEEVSSTFEYSNEQLPKMMLEHGKLEKVPYKPKALSHGILDSTHIADGRHEDEDEADSYYYDHVNKRLTAHSDDMETSYESPSNSHPTLEDAKKAVQNIANGVRGAVDTYLNLKGK